MPKTSRLSPRRVREAFGIRLKQARQRKFETAAEFARSIDVHPATYGRWERGEVEPGIAHLIELVRATEVSADFLVSGDLPPPETKS